MSSPTGFPDLELLLSMEPEELAGKLLFVARRLTSENSMKMVAMGNLISSLFTTRPDGTTAFPRENTDAVTRAITEAWVWLEAQGLLVPADDTNGRNGWRVLSRRASRFEDERDFSLYSASRYLHKELLHPAISASVWSAFLRGEYDVAVFQAIKAVEIAVRTAANLPNSDYGITLMRKAFNPKDGPLTDLSEEPSERDALANLFAGAVGYFKNAHSHRDVNLTDPVEAMEVVMQANHLLRIVDRRSAARGALKD